MLAPAAFFPCADVGVREALEAAGMFSENICEEYRKYSRVSTMDFSSPGLENLQRLCRQRSYVKQSDIRGYGVWELSVW